MASPLVTQALSGDNRDLTLLAARGMLPLAPEALVDGERNIQELRVQGESMRIEARDSVLIRKLGNVRGVHGDVNGRPLQLPTAVGQVLSNFLIDRAMAGLPPLPGGTAAPTR